MKVLRESWLFFLRKNAEVMRNPVYISMGISTPILYLLLFAPLLEHSGMIVNNIMLELFVPGMLVMMAFFTGIFSGFGIIQELKNGVIQRFYITPCSRISILAGYLLKDVVSVTLQSIIFIGVAFLLGYRCSPVVFVSLLLLLIMVVLVASAFSNGLGLLLKSPEFLAPIVQGINLPLMLLSGVLIPMDFAPKWLYYMAHFNPLYYAVEAGRSLQRAVALTPTVIEAISILSVLILISLLFSLRSLKKSVA